MPCAAAISVALEGPNTSCTLPQSGHLKELMFSTSPRTGTFIMSAIRTAFSTTSCTRSCGEVTTTAPATGSDWNTVSGTSPVPGGMSTNITSTSPQTTSLQNCFTAPAITGPRQTTGDLGSSTSRLSDITPIPHWVRQGRMPPSPSATARSARPKAVGMDGPVTSASRMAVLSPRWDAATASSSVTSDLPTPPLPLMTAMTLPMRLFELAAT